jgi:hypothetical protein
VNGKTKSSKAKYYNNSFFSGDFEATTINQFTVVAVVVVVVAVTSESCNVSSSS